MLTHVGTLSGPGSGTPLVTTGLGFQPKAIVFFSSGNFGDNTSGGGSELNLTFGFWAAGYGVDGQVRQRSRGIHHVVGAGTQFASISTTKEAVLSHSNGIGEDVRVTAVGPDGFTTVWTNWGAGQTAGFIAFGGDDLQAQIVSMPYTVPAAATASYVQESGPLGFSPAGVVAISHGDDPGNLREGMTSLGYAGQDGTQFCLMQYLQGTPVETKWSGFYQGVVGFGDLPRSETIQVIGYKNNRVQLRHSAVSAGAARNAGVDLLVLGGVSAQAVVGNRPSTQTVQSFATQFLPKAMMLAAPQSAATAANVEGSIGATDGTRHASIAWRDVSGSALRRYTSRNNLPLIFIANDTASPPTYTRWVTGPTFAKTQAQMTWNGSTAETAPVGAFFVGNAGPKLEGIIDITSEMPASPVLSRTRPLNGIVEASLAWDENPLGALGNFAGQSVIDAAFSLQTPGIGFARPLEGELALTSELTSPGIGFSRPLSGAIEAALTLEGSKIGRLWENTGAIDAAFTLDVPGIGFPRPLAGVIPVESDINGYFQLPMPPVRPAGRDDLLGTVNLVVNPSVESGLTGWRGVGVTPEWSLESAWDGKRSAKYVTASAGQGLLVESATGMEFTGWARDAFTGEVLEGQLRTMASQVRIRSTTGPWTATFRTRAVYQDLSVTESDPLEAEVTTDWRVYYPPAVQLDPAKVLIRVEIEALADGARTFYGDGAQVEEDRGQGPTPWVTGAYGRDSGEWVNPYAPDQSISVRQPLPAIIRGIGRGGQAVITPTLYRTDQNNVIQDDISDLVIEGRATMDVSRRSTWSFDATLNPLVWDYMRPNEDWIAPWLKIEYPNGEVKEGQLGHYYLTPAAMQRGEYSSKVRLSAFDSLWLLDREELVGSQAFPANTDYAEAIRQVIAGGIMPDGSSFRRFHIPDSGILMAQAFEWDEGTTRLRAALELCEGGAVYPLWTDPTGYITTMRMGSWRFRDRTPVKAYTAHIPEGVVVDPWIPRVSALKSEVVGEVATSPRALDFVDKILVHSADPRVQPISSQATLVYADAPPDGLLDSLDDPDMPVVLQEWYRKNRQRGSDGRRRQGSRQGRRRMRALPYSTVGRSVKYPSRLVTSQAAAQVLAQSMADDLSARVEHVGLSVFPDPSVDWAYATVMCNIWDAFENAVAVGQYLVRRVTFGFTPKTAMQTMDLDWIDPGESQIVVAS